MIMLAINCKIFGIKDENIVENLEILKKFPIFPISFSQNLIKFQDPKNRQKVAKQNFCRHGKAKNRQIGGISPNWWHVAKSSNTFWSC